MDKKEEFKLFVKKNPKLVNYIKDGSMNWQKFYEIYDIYGDNEEAWKSYLGVSATIGGSEILSWIKSIDLDNVQNGINNLQRVIGLLGDLGSKDKPKEEYKPRPIYKHFED